MGGGAGRRHRHWGDYEGGRELTGEEIRRHHALIDRARESFDRSRCEVDDARDPVTVRQGRGVGGVVSVVVD